MDEDLQLGAFKSEALSLKNAVKRVANLGDVACRFKHQCPRSGAVLAFVRDHL